MASTATLITTFIAINRSFATHCTVGRCITTIIVIVAAIGSVGFQKAATAEVVVAEVQ